VYIHFPNSITVALHTSLVVTNSFLIEFPSIFIEGRRIFQIKIMRYTFRSYTGYVGPGAHSAPYSMITAGSLSMDKADGG